MKTVFLAVLLLSFAGASALIQPEVAFWSDLGEGEGTIIADQSGYGNAGYTSGPVFWDATAKPANLPHSLALSTSFVGVPSTAQTRVGQSNQSYTVSLWFNTSDANSVITGVYGQYAEDRPIYPVYASVLPSGVIVALWDGVSNPFAIGGPNLIDGQWHHLVVVRDAVVREVIVYVDGDESFRFVDTTTGDMSRTNDLTFGYNPATGFPMTGSIAQPIIATSALSRYEVERLYNRGRGLTYEQFFSSTEIPEFSSVALTLVILGGVALVAATRTR